MEKQFMHNHMPEERAIKIKPGLKTLPIKTLQIEVEVNNEVNINKSFWHISYR